MSGTRVLNQATLQSTFWVRTSVVLGAELFLTKPLSLSAVSKVRLTVCEFIAHAHSYLFNGSVTLRVSECAGHMICLMSQPPCTNIESDTLNVDIAWQIAQGIEKLRAMSNGAYS